MRRRRCSTAARSMPALAVLGFLVAACGTRGYVPRFSPIDSDGQVLRDAQGRTVILRGYNAKSPGIFDVSFDDGTPPRETVPPLDATDFQAMRANGANVLRLPINWSAIEPTRGQYETAYLDSIASFIDSIRPYGIYVLLDLHEDGWSKYLCEDGSPLWAIYPPISGPVEPATGLENTDCHTSSQALAAHSAFFSDIDQFQEAYIAMFQQVATRFRDDSTVFAYELMNEPIADDPTVDAFSRKLAAAVRAVDAKHLILWEPSAVRNITNVALKSSAPFGVPGAVYAIHIYTVAGPTLTDSVASATEEARDWALPLFVTEHGADPTDAGLQFVDQLLDLFDQTGTSSMDWIWNPGVVTRNSDGSLAGVFGGQVLANLSRPYAPAIGGDAEQVLWDGSSLTVQFRGHQGVPAVHDIFWNLGAPAMTCDGKALSVPRPRTGSVYSVTCGGAGTHTLVVSQAG